MKLSIILFVVIKCILLCNVSCLHQLNYEQFAKRLYQYDPLPLYATPSQASQLPGDNVGILPPRTLLKPSLERYNARNEKLYYGYPRSQPDYSMDYLKNKYLNMNYVVRRNDLTQADNAKTPELMSQDLNTLNVVTVPPNCPTGQPDQDGYCRDVWPQRSPPSQKESAKQNELTQAEKEKIRDWMSNHVDVLNVVTVPPNCPTGQPDKDGYCRDVWSHRTLPSPSLVKASAKENELTQADKEKIHNWISKQLETLNAITVPRNCPSGQPDQNGVCRDDWPRRSRESSGQFRSAETYTDGDNMTK